MRELKFRVWDKSFHRMKITGIGYNRGVLDGDDVEIMQYTGLKDKHGKEIYEGDMLTCRVFIKGKSVVVQFRNGAWHTGDKYSFLYPSRIWEVIGNIYENPELTQVEFGKEIEEG